MLTVSKTIIASYTPQMASSLISFTLLTISRRLSMNVEIERGTFPSSLIQRSVIVHRGIDFENLFLFKKKKKNASLDIRYRKIKPNKNLRNSAIVFSNVMIQGFSKAYLLLNDYEKLPRYNAPKPPHILVTLYLGETKNTMGPVLIP